MTGIIIPAYFVSWVIPLIFAVLRLAVLFPFIVLVDREIPEGFHLALPYPMDPQSQRRTLCKLLSVSAPLQESDGAHCAVRLDSEPVCHTAIVSPRFDCSRDSPMLCS